MDNQGYNNEENRWVEERIARLSPPPGWRPDADRALEHVLQQGKPASTSRGLRISMAAATLAAIAVVLTLLPWHMLWTPNSSEGTVTTQQPALPAQANPGTSEPPTVTRAVVPAVAPVQEEIKQNPTAAAVSVQQTPLQPGGTPRQKKFPRIIASAAEKEGATIMQAAAQGQGQPAPPPPSSVGNGVSEPVLVSQVQPTHTPEAREARIQGTVELLVIVREDGTVKADKVRKSLGYGLDEAAVAAVEQWKFIPGKKDGKPVPVWVSVLVNFTLR